jgi:hypothetical protein
MRWHYPGFRLRPRQRQEDLSLLNSFVSYLPLLSANVETTSIGYVPICQRRNG